VLTVQLTLTLCHVTALMNIAFVGVHSWVREALKIGMKGNTSGVFFGFLTVTVIILIRHVEYIWSSVDFIPKTNFPDIRNFSVVSSASGGCIIVPREDGKIRMFVQLEPSKEMYDPAGHMDLSKVSWQRVMRVSCRR
jgi:phenol 2-monooxygenase